MNLRVGMALAPGARIGSYEVTALIGMGGMGEVYRARDTKLDRDVAIKVLPASLAADAERVARFEREAKTLAALNHPNIAQIHGVEEGPDTTALVLELVEGPTLADRIAQGPIPIDEALPIATQIAEALEAAHEQGIIHRDLKPANVKLRSDGTVKVLDFGLAKATEPTWASPRGSKSPTLTMPAMTQAGSILGTATYMSPEQAKGLAVDKRTDVWALGCVLYEMLTGRRAFAGDDVTETLASVLRTEPAWDMLPAGLSPALNAHLRRCLHKEPKQRIHDVADVRLALEGAFDSPAAAADAVGDRAAGWRRVRGRTAVVGVVALLVGVGLGRTVLERPTTPPPRTATRLTLPVYPGYHLADGVVPEVDATLQRPTRRSFVLSPDGRQLVYVASAGETTRLYLRPLDQLQATPIPGTEGATSPFMAPDGASVAFFVGTQLKTLALATGDVRTLATSGPRLFPLGGSWTDNDTILVSAEDGIYEVPSTGGRLSLLVPGEDPAGDLLYPELLPGGRAVLFNAGATLERTPSDWNIAVASLETGERRVVVEGGSDPRYVASGHIVFVRAGILMAIPFDAARLEVTGDEVAVVEDVMHAEGGTLGGINSGAGQFSVSRSGSLAYVPGGTYARREFSLAWVDRSGATERLPLPPGAYSGPLFSPDGTRLTYVDNASEGAWIWVYDIELGVPIRLATANGRASAVWSPDSTRLAFSSTDDRRLFWTAADGSGKPQPLIESGPGFPSSWSRDHVLAFVRSGDIWTISTEEGDEPAPFLTTPAAELWPAFSPDGRWLSYASDETGRFEVYVRPFPRGEPASRVSTAGGRAPVWSRDQRQLFFRTPGEFPVQTEAVMVVDVNTNGTFRGSPPRILFEEGESRFRATGPVRSYDISPDGRRFVMADGAALNESQPVTSLNIVLDWFTELERRAPPRQR